MSESGAGTPAGGQDALQMLDGGAVTRVALRHNGARRAQSETGVLGDAAQRLPALVAAAHVGALRRTGASQQRSRSSHSPGTITLGFR